MTSNEQISSKKGGMGKGGGDAVSSRSFDLLNMSGLEISVSNMRENMLFSGEVYTADTAGSDGRDKSHL